IAPWAPEAHCAPTSRRTCARCRGSRAAREPSIPEIVTFARGRSCPQSDAPRKPAQRAAGVCGTMRLRMPTGAVLVKCYRAAQAIAIAGLMLALAVVAPVASGAVGRARVAARPPMGWDSWGSLGCGVKESDV